MVDSLTFSFVWEEKSRTHLCMGQRIHPASWSFRKLHTKFWSIDRLFVRVELQNLSLLKEQSFFFYAGCIKQLANNGEAKRNGQWVREVFTEEFHSDVFQQWKHIDVSDISGLNSEGTKWVCFSFFFCCHLYLEQIHFSSDSAQKGGSAAGKQRGVYQRSPENFSGSSRCHHNQKYLFNPPATMEKGKNN